MRPTQGSVSLNSLNLALWLAASLSIPPSLVHQNPGTQPRAKAGIKAQAPRLEMAEVKAVTNAIPDAADIEKIIAPIRVEIMASFEQPLVNSPKGLFRGRGVEENLLGYWIADAMRIRGSVLSGAPVKFAITNRGGVRANLRPGMLKVGDIFEVMPFDNELVIMELTGEEVMQVVREGVLRRGGEPCSGVKVRVEGQPERPIVTTTWEDGTPIDPKAMVKVATTDYLFNGGDSIPTLKKGRRPFTTGLPLRQVLLDMCGDLAKQKQDLVAPQGGRFLYSPEIAKAIIERRGLGN